MMKRLLTLPIVAVLALVACDDGGKTPLAPEAVALPETIVPNLSHVIPVTVSGNPTCGDLGQGEFELRIQPVEDGTYSDGTLTVTIDVRSTSDGQVFDFTSNIPIASVVVKGGPGGNHYVFDPPVTSHTGLHAPVNPSNGTYYGLSHLSFCYDVKPSVKVTKTGDALSKIGDDVKYTFLIENNGTLPLELTSIVDDKLGDLSDEAPTACDELAIGASCTFDVSYKIPEGSSDPHVNVVKVVYGSAKGSAESTDDHSINLFQPSIELTKTAHKYSKIGDDVDYVITLKNTSSADSPDLICTVADELLDLSKPVTLESGASDVTNASRTVVASDPDPLVNKATASCSPENFPNVIEAEASASTDLLQPAWTLTKECVNSPVPAGQPAQFKVTIANTGTANLVVVISDPSMPGIDGTHEIDVGDAPVVLTGSIAVPAGAATVSNTVNAVITLDPYYGLDNRYEDSETAHCNVPPPPGLEGCTPGYWKAPQHFDSWSDPYDPDDKLSTVFTLPTGFPDVTLVEALDFGGGSGLDGARRNLLRAAVAAILNAANDDVDYPMAEADIITAVNAALVSTNRNTILQLAAKLDGFNNLGCPLS